MAASSLSVLFRALENIGQLLKRRVETVILGRLFTLRVPAFFRLRRAGPSRLLLLVLGFYFRVLRGFNRAATVDRAFKHRRNARPIAFDLRLGDQTLHRLYL